MLRDKNLELSHVCSYYYLYDIVYVFKKLFSLRFDPSMCVIIFDDTVM